LIDGALGTLDKKGRRLFVYPLEVKGQYRALRDKIYFVLILFFLILPWIRIDDRQLVLLDIPGRKFTIFGLQFWAHDAPMLFFVFGGFAITLIFVTAIWGRVWCGWACPQTVFIDGVYRRIEKWVEGTAPKRKALDQAPWTWNKFKLRTIKHFLFLIVTLHITHSFLAYFVGSKELIAMSLRPPTENWISFLFIMASTALLYFNFAWFREQFCIIMCPYGRLQSALFDKNSMVVGYDTNRSDCIECKRCVYVCPTAIDIRQGVQMECIACTACMDACDDIMDKVKKPRGLIRYLTEVELAGKKVKHIRPRTVGYAFIWLVIFALFIGVLTSRKPVDFKVVKSELLPKSNPKESSVFRYTLEVSNQTFKDTEFLLALPDEANKVEMVAPDNPVNVPAGKVQKISFFLKMPSNSFDLPDFALKIKANRDEIETIDLPLKR
jgi:cytochrome c oxidase accessory protein FixG